MTTGNITISAETKKQIGLLLNMIAANAATMKNTANETLQYCGRGPAATMVALMSPLASEIGYQAETCLKRLGENPEMLEGPEYWFLPPRCQENCQHSD